MDDAKFNKWLGNTLMAAFVAVGTGITAARLPFESRASDGLMWFLVGVLTGCVLIGVEKCVKYSRD